MNDQAKKSANREKKEIIVAELATKVDRAKTMIFTNYEGLTHKQIETFKNDIRPMDAEFAITKNTLLKRALGEKVKDQADKFEQPTGTVYVYGDPVEPLKILAKMIKDFEKPKVKFGLLDGNVITEAQVLKLATLPSRQILITQMVTMMNSPIQGLHRALSWNLQKFVMTLKAIEDQKSKQA